MSQLTDIQLWGTHLKPCGHLTTYWCACKKQTTGTPHGPLEPLGHQPHNLAGHPVRVPNATGPAIRHRDTSEG